MRLLTSRDPSLVTMVEVHVSNDATENTDIEDVNLTSIEHFYKEYKNFKRTVCGGGKSLEWTCGDVLCIFYVRQENNRVSSNSRRCMVMKKRVKHKRRFMNKRSG